MRRKQIMDYFLLPAEQQIWMYCHFAWACFSEILETLKRAQEQSDMLLYSIFGAYENGQHCSSEAHRMLVKHSIVLASSLIFLDYDRTTV